jgi:hypothetical protein
MKPIGGSVALRVARSKERQEEKKKNCGTGAPCLVFLVQRACGWRYGAQNSNHNSQTMPLERNKKRITCTALRKGSPAEPSQTACAGAVPRKRARTLTRSSVFGPKETGPGPGDSTGRRPNRSLSQCRIRCDSVTLGTFAHQIIIYSFFKDFSILR